MATGNKGSRSVTGRVTIVLALVVVASLNAILLLGAAGSDVGAPPGLLGGAVLTLDISLVSSSLLLGVHFLRRKQGILSALFFGNLGLFVAAAVLLISGLTIRPLILFAADLYWLNLYLIVLTRHWRQIIGTDASLATEPPTELSPDAGPVRNWG